MESNTKSSRPHLLKEKTVQLNKPLQRPVRWHSPPTGGVRGGLKSEPTEKTVQLNKPLQRPVRWHSPPTGGVGGGLKS
jgi:hypothetical protein